MQGFLAACQSGTPYSLGESLVPFLLASTPTEARQLMPAVSLGARLVVSHQKSTCFARLPVVRNSLVNTTVLPPYRVAPSTARGNRSACQSSLTIDRINKYRSVVTATSKVDSFLSTSQRMAANGEVRSKRKKSPIKVMDRPSKIYKHDPYLNEAENGHSPEDDAYSMETDGEDRISLPPTTATADSAEWQATIEKVVRNVVSIHFCQTCSFDTDSAISSEATGFVVDAERGYILTNRHVVGAGPFWGYCIFDNHEEVGHPHSTVQDQLY